MATTLSQALFRIDPTEGLLQYVQEVKPYHSKVLDVFVEYVYAEKLATQIKDKAKLDLTMVGANSDVPVTYSCGYGFVWNPYSDAGGDDLPQATIIKAQGPINIVATPTVSSQILVTTPDVSGFTFTVDQPVVLRTTGNYPAATRTLGPGITYYVLSVSGTSLRISDQIGGPPIAYTSAGTGTLTVHPQNLPYNSFLVGLSGATPRDIVVADLTKNQLVMATPYPITAANGGAKQVTVTGNLVSGSQVLTAGDTVYINGNSNAAANGKVTVASATISGSSTIVVFNEPISLLTAGNGRLNVPIGADVVPYWPAGAAVDIQSTGGFPSPVNSTTTYYFNPTTTFGLFNLAKTRYPQKATDIVDLTTLGADQLTVTRTEPFVPGDSVIVSGSYNGINDRAYTINGVAAEGSDYRLTVLETVSQTTPVGLSTDGQMLYTGSFGDAYCAVASAPDLYTAAFFSERIQFDFGPAAALAYLLDTFSGTGDLSTHTVDSGHIWTVFQLADSLSEMILTGSGTVTTADTDIWVRSNWAAPSNGNFYVEVDLNVKAAPSSGDPYFRMFAKESNLTSFHGPQVDIYPDLATGKIMLLVADTDGTTNHTQVINSFVSVDQQITVKLQVIGGHQFRVYINNNLAYTSATLTYPSLTFTGFNFRVPAGDPTQFGLSRITAVNT